MSLNTNETTFTKKIITEKPQFQKLKKIHYDKILPILKNSNMYKSHNKLLLLGLIFKAILATMH